MSESTRSRWAAACRSSSLPFSTSLPTCPSVTSRALSRPASTKRWSTSLRTTGMSAAAMTWAISPPTPPAPTTAALNTNMARTLASAPELALRRDLRGEAAQRAPERLGERAANEQQVDDRCEQVSLLQPVVQGEEHPDALGSRLERDRLDALQPPVLNLERLARAALVGGDPLDDSPAPGRRRVPHEPAADLGPAVVERDDVAEPVDPRRPARRVIP